VTVRKIDVYLTFCKASKISNSSNKLQWLFGFFDFSLITVFNDEVKRIKKLIKELSGNKECMSEGWTKATGRKVHRSCCW